MVGALGKNETRSPDCDGVVDIRANLIGAVIVIHEGTEHGLDGRSVFVCHNRFGLVYDQLSAHECCVGDILGGDFVSGGAALEGDDPFEAVAFGMG